MKLRLVKVHVEVEKAAGVVTGTLSVLRKVSQWVVLLLMVALPSITNAIQPNAEYLVREKQFGKQWVDEDNQVQDKLTAPDRC